MNILESQTFKRVLFFKFLMLILAPSWLSLLLLIPVVSAAVGLNVTDSQLAFLWGIIYIVNFLVHAYIFKFSHRQLSKNLLLFSALDNVGIGLVGLFFIFTGSTNHLETLFSYLACKGCVTPTFILYWPWEIWITAAISLFFGYWFWRFYKEGKFAV